MEKDAEGAAQAQGYALAGMRVVDLSNHAVGPFASQLLAGLGATVIKVERPPKGDMERSTEPPMFYACNQGKHSVALNVGDPEDRAVLEKLIRECDVLIEGFRPGAADRMGLGFEQVRDTLQREIIYVSLPGFGATGPYVARRAYDTELRAVSGDIYLNRDENGVPRYAHAIPSFDYACAMYAVIGVMGAWMTRGAGAQHIESSILGAGLAWAFARLLPYEHEAGERREYVFRASDDRYLTITAADPTLFRSLCLVIDRPDLEKDGQPTVPFATLNAILREVVATASRDEWLRRFEGAGVASAPVLEPAEVFVDPQVTHLGIVGMEPQPWSRTPIFGLPIRKLAPPPKLDQHGEAIRAGGWAAVEGAEHAPERGE
jgi:crotonobetainyl-CoA:carnitine CoA-transferase CaiB-like acyl-CoA transferase